MEYDNWLKFQKERKRLIMRKKLYPWVVETLRRDMYTCVDCGDKESYLVVHHIDESRKNGISKMNNNLDNLVTLCKYCHARTHKLVVMHEDILEMRRMGMTFQEIASQLKISRQRAHQLYKSALRG